jgi:hypothetical protein
MTPILRLVRPLTAAQPAAARCPRESRGAVVRIALAVAVYEFPWIRFVAHFAVERRASAKVAIRFGERDVTDE